MPNFFVKYTGKTLPQLFTDATSAAKARIGSSIVKTAANDPNVREDIKAGVGTRIGVWIIENWMYIAAAFAALGAIFFFRRRR